MHSAHSAHSLDAPRWAAPRCAGPSRPGLGRVGLSWSALGWTGLGWAGLVRAELGWAELVAELVRAGLDWTGLGQALDAGSSPGRAGEGGGGRGGPERGGWTPTGRDPDRERGPWPAGPGAVLQSAGSRGRRPQPGHEERGGCVFVGNTQVTGGGGTARLFLKGN